jgi:pseudouridylate synthase I
MLTELRKFLPEDIGAIALEEAEPRFHARLSCREKTYVYRVWNSDAPNVFERRYLYVFPVPLDTDAMRAAADTLLGEHDFSAFCSNKHLKKSAVRKLNSIEIERYGGELRLAFTGNGFLYNMVRILTGTLLEVGAGQRSIESVCAALDSRDRERAGFTAPAQGLMLWDVRY